MISIPYLNKSLFCEVTIGSKKCIIGTVYNLLVKILMNLCLYQTLSFYFRIFPIATLIEHCYSVIIMQEMQSGDILILQQLKELETTTTIYGLQELIDEPHHIRKNSSSCIDLIFTNHTSFSS